MNDFVKPIAEFFNVDLSTMYRSVASGTSSTGLGIYLTNVSNFNWRFELNLVSLVWGMISCIILTLLSMLVQDAYKYVKKKINNSKKVDNN